MVLAGALSFPRAMGVVRPAKAATRTAAAQPKRATQHPARMGPSPDE